MPILFDNSYARLPARFYALQPPEPAPAPALLRLNEGLAERLGLDTAALRTPEGVAMLAGGALPASAQPLSMAYAGHQFGNWVPQLGDGRAVLLGEVVAPDGKRFDLHLKGAGRTPFSRGGDGKAALGPVLREYIVSEAMAALGVPTTRALAASLTGEIIRRETPEPGAVLARVAASHIRVGTFQYFYARKDTEALEALMDHVIQRHYPGASEAEVPALALLGAVAGRQADLIAHWMQIGFIHGVMNTDNMTISGETIDYGPCAFMDTYNPAQVFSSIDHQGRYAFANQPAIAHWNLAQLAQSLLPLLPGDPEKAASQAQGVLDGFAPAFASAYGARFAAKIGLGQSSAQSRTMIETLLDLMAKDKVDFTVAFSTLTRGAQSGDLSAFQGLFTSHLAAQAWVEIWQDALGPGGMEKAAEIMRRANPRIIPRNHRVEQAIKAAYDQDLQPFETLIEAVKSPFQEQPEFTAYEAPPQPHEVIAATFCGT